MSALEASVTLDDVFAVVEAKRVPLAPELAGYLALEIADGTDAGSGDVDPKTVFISEEGTVALVRPRRDVVTGEAESSIRALLAKLLDTTGSATPALSVAAKRKPGNGLPALVEELEAALIPVNRAAGRRALARLARETKRVTMGIGRNASSPPLASNAPDVALPPPPPAPRVFDDEAVTIPRKVNPISDPPKGGSSLPPPPGSPASAPPPPPPPRARTQDRLFANKEVDSLLDSFEVSGVSGDKQLSRDLKAIAGMSPTPPPPNASAAEAMSKAVPANQDKEPDGVEALLALAESSSPLAPPLPPRGFPAKPSPKVDPAPVPPAPPPPAAPPASPIGSAPARRRRRSSSEPRAPKTSLALLVTLLFVLAGAVAFVWWKAPRLFTGKRRPAASATASVAPAPPPAPKCKVALEVTGAPANAEILLRMGQAPLDVERMPVGTRLEFVGTAEGYAPKRAVVNAESTWDKGPEGKPRIELPIQLDPSKAKTGAVDPWPSAEPGSQVGGSGPPGVVHVVSNVRGAEVWLLAGLGPEARIEQLACDGDVDVLLAGSSSLRKRVHVPESDIAAAPADPQGSKVVTVSVK